MTWEQQARALGATWWSSMLDGQFEQAWRASDGIRALGMDDPQRLWQGEDFTGRRVIVRCLHGFGDSVQMLRLLPLLAARAAHVTLEVAPRFVELARCFDGAAAANIITWGDDAPRTPPAWDVQIEVMEIPYALRLQPAQLPGPVPYLYVAPAPTPPARPLQVGLVWTAGEWNRARGVPFALLQPLLEAPLPAAVSPAFLNLTAKPAPCGVGAALLEDTRCRDSVLGLAQRIAALDLVITVDTLAAHLAGALGIPALVLLRHEADWRWQRARSDSPWYPTLTLLRQDETCRWEPVIDRAAALLEQRVATYTARHTQGAPPFFPPNTP